MGIDSGYGIGSLRTGVCTSTTRPASPFDGQTISETDTDSLVVYKGTAWGQVSGLVLVKTQTIGTTVTSVNVTSAFSTTYDRYLVTLSGGTSTNTRALNLTLGATTTGYYSSYTLVTYASTTVVGGASSNASSILDAALVSSNGLSGRFELNNPFNAVRTEILNCYGGLVTNNQYLSGAGFVDNATSYTDFTLTMASTGTMTGGTIYVYGYAKA